MITFWNEKKTIVYFSVFWKQMVTLDRFYQCFRGRQFWWLPVKGKNLLSREHILSLQSGPSCCTTARVYILHQHQMQIIQWQEFFFFLLTWAKGQEVSFVFLLFSTITTNMPSDAIGPDVISSHFAHLIYMYSHFGMVELRFIFLCKVAIRCGHKGNFFSSSKKIKKISALDQLNEISWNFAGSISHVPVLWVWENYWFMYAPEPGSLFCENHKRHVAILWETFQIFK